MVETNSGNDDQITNDIINETTEDSDDEDEYNTIEYLDNKIFQRLKQNDPAVTYLCIPLHCDDDSECFFNSIDWKVDGDCIAKNTHIKRLRIAYHGQCLGRPYGHYILGEEGHNLPTRQQLQDFFSCINRNSSIKNLGIVSTSIVTEFGSGLLGGLCSHPSLIRLEIEWSSFGSIGCKALKKVLNHPESKLKELRLLSNGLDDEGIRCLSGVLLGNSRIMTLVIIVNRLRLNLDYNEQITSDGWRILSNVIRHPNCNLIELELYNALINDTGASILGEAISGSSMKALNLHYNQSISSSGWNALINQLPRTSIVSLNLSSNKIDDAGLPALVNIGTLKSLNLRGNRSITPSGWRSFFNSLQRKGTQLKLLEISVNKVGDVGVAALSSLLINMNTLKTLGMSGMYSSYHGGNIASHWVSLFPLLHGSNLDLAKLYLHGNTIDDEGLQLLVSLVSRMSSLKCLDLGSNDQVTPTGWLALTELLQNPTCTLERLILGDIDLNCYNYINDDTVVAFTSALAGNKTLKWLSLEYCTEEDEGDLITERGWDAFSALICNKTSIMDTYNSNHTLHGLGDLDIDDDDDDDDGIKQMNLPDDLKSYLDLNKNKDKAEVARQKILQTHFSNGDTSRMQELLDMDLEVLPTVVEWIGRPVAIHWSGMNVSGLLTMYNLVRKMPDLFDTSAQKNSTKKPSGASI